MHRTFKSLKSLLFLITALTTTFPIATKRHSLVRKSERVEQRKKVVITDDESLATLLKKQTKYMTFIEASRAFDYYKTSKEPEMQIKCGQRLLAVGGDQEIMRKTRLELAELFLEKSSFNDAEKYAQEYQKLYPGTQESLRAQYLAIQANYQAKLSFDRDQQKTRTALTLALEFLEKHPDEKELSPIIQELIHDCYQTIIRHEMHIITTQMNTYRYTSHKGTLDAAHKRLEHVKKAYLPHAAIAKARISELELEIVQAQGNAQKTALLNAELEELNKQKEVEAIKKSEPKLIIAQANKQAEKMSGLGRLAKRFQQKSNAQYFGIGNIPEEPTPSRNKVSLRA